MYTGRAAYHQNILLPTSHSPVCSSLEDIIEELNIRRDPNQETVDILMEEAFDEFTLGKYNDYLDRFLFVLDKLLLAGGDPNVRLNKTVEIFGVYYDSLSCWQVAYFMWRQWVDGEESVEAEQAKKIFDRILEDIRVDVRQEFCEGFGGYHFSTNGQDECQLIHATIAHYAVAVGDVVTAEKMIARAPDLIHIPCSMIQGRTLLMYHHGSITWSHCIRDQLSDEDLSDNEIELGIHHLAVNASGRIASVMVSSSNPDRKVSREDLRRNTVEVVSAYNLTQVTLLHLAARGAHLLACASLAGRCPELRNREDCLGNNPLKYFGYMSKNLNINVDSELGRYLSRVDLIGRDHLPPTSVVQYRLGYTIYYDPRLKLPSYAYEMLTPNSLKGNASRKGMGFVVDKTIPDSNRTWSDDFKNQGFDRGHACPAGDAVRSSAHMRATFVYTNVMAMNPDLNKHYWNWQVEDTVRRFVHSNHYVEVFTGPLFCATVTEEGRSVTYPVFGRNDIAVPTHFFKVLFIGKGKTVTRKAIIVPNEPIPMDKPLTDFEVSVDRVQQLSGILFERRSWASR